MDVITNKRLDRFSRVAARRQQMTVILENVHDPHNIGAVMRTCDSVGIQEIYVLYTDEHLSQEHLDFVQGSSTGVRKWLDIHFYEDVDKCMSAVKSKYDKVYATHLDNESVSIYDTDLSQNVALLFGNERDGVSRDCMAYVDGNILIPQQGMVMSLNISVACAVTVYEASRQRINKEMYNNTIAETDQWRNDIKERYIDIHNSRYKR